MKCLNDDILFCFLIFEVNSNENLLVLISLQNLAESIDNVGLHDLFQEYGNILSSKIVMSEDGKSKGFGYIQFDSEESANDAIQKMNGSTVRDKQMYEKLF